MEFLENHIRALYRFLNHGKDFSDVRCIDVNQGKFISRELVKSESSVVEWAKKYNGKGNCFIGRNPRNESGDVSRITSFSLDIDPERDKGTSSSENQLRLSVESGRRILQSVKGGYLGCSGNGTLLLFRLRYGRLQPKEVEDRLRSLQEQSRLLCSPSVKIDNTQDNARMIKLLGTMSVKGDFHRVSRFIDMPVVPYKVSDALETIVLSQEKVKEERKVITDYSFTQAQRLELIEKALPLLKFNRVEDYDSWIKVGMALKEFGLVGLRLWDKWSKQSGKYSSEVVQSKWRTFNEESGITIGSVIHWAREDSGQAIRLGSSQSESFNRQSVVHSDITFTPNGNLVQHKERLLSKSRHKGPEISTGLPVLDGYTWGLMRGELFTVAARTGVGKTSFATGIVKNVLQSGKRVLFFSTEMSTELIINRLLSSYTRISGNAFKSGQFSDEDRAKLDDGYTWLEGIGSRLTVCDLSGPSIETVKALTEKHKPDVVVFDHIQHISGGNDVRTTVSEFTRGLKDVARNHSCSVLVLSQLRRMFRDPKSGLMPAPQLSDLKESGTIEEESGQVLLLSEHSTEPGSSICILVGELAKNRFGECTRVAIEFDRSTANFRESLDVVVAG